MCFDFETENLHLFSHFGNFAGAEVAFIEAGDLLVGSGGEKNGVCTPLAPALVRIHLFIATLSFCLSHYTEQRVFFSFKGCKYLLLSCLICIVV